MYRTVRGTFEQFDKTLIHSAQTLGLSNTFIFWRILIPNSRYGIIAGTVLAFARGLGEFGATIMLAGNLPGKTRRFPLPSIPRWPPETTRSPTNGC
jgi:molybdate transport system permease protein